MKGKTFIAVILVLMSGLCAAGEIKKGMERVLAASGKSAAGSSVSVEAHVGKAIGIQNGWRWGAEMHRPSASVIQLRVRVGGKDIFIPISAFADMANPKRIYAKPQDNGFMLSIEGGDAATSYIAELDFAESYIISRKIRSAEFPESAWEETRFSFTSME